MSFEPVFGDEQMFEWEHLQLKNINTQKFEKKIDLAGGIGSAKRFIL
jgi:hypothetical protein